MVPVELWILKNSNCLKNDSIIEPMQKKRENS